MRGPKIVVVAAVVFLAIFGCSSSKEVSKHSQVLDRLAAYMTGSFSSAAQAQADTDYLDIRLHMSRIWKERTDGYWLYVEQATASRLEKPYRQRVYHLTQRRDGTFESVVFTVSDPLRFAGDWKKDNPLATLTVDSLSERAGCSIVLRTEGDVFEGSTVGKECPSDLRSAAYATSEVRISVDRLVSWDRGWGKDDKQVWGAEKGGYVFLKSAN
jgi:hypothetical protein